MKRTWFNAIYNRSYKDVESMLPFYDDWRTDDGSTGLMLAAKMGSLSLVKLLLKHDIGKRNNAGETALIIASKYDNVNIACVLVTMEAGVMDNKGHCALYWAIRLGSTQLFDVLLHYEQHLVDEHGATMLMKAAWYSQPQFVMKLKESLLGQKDYAGDTALIYAILGGSPWVMEMLLEEVCLYNSYGSNGLMEAIKCGYGDHLVDILPEESLRSLVGARDKNGRTSLMYAILYNARYAAEVLVKYERDMQDNHGDTAALIADRIGATDYLAIFNQHSILIEDLESTDEIIDEHGINVLCRTNSVSSTLNETNQQPIFVEPVSQFSQKDSNSHNIPIESNSSVSDIISDTASDTPSVDMRSITTSPVYGHEFNYLHRQKYKTKENKPNTKHVSKAYKSKALTYKRVKALFNPSKGHRTKGAKMKRGRIFRNRSAEQATSLSNQQSSSIKVRQFVRKKKKSHQKSHKMVTHVQNMLVSFSTMDAPSSDSKDSDPMEESIHEISEAGYDTLPLYCTDREKGVKISPSAVIFSGQSYSRPPSVWTSISRRESVPLNEHRAKSYSKKYIKALITGNILQVRKLGQKEKQYGHYHGDTALMYAVRVNNPSLIRVLAPLEAGRLNPAGESALMIAARKNKFFAAKFLVPYEAGYQDTCKYTALMYAAQHGNLSIVKLLARKEVTMQNRTGETALMLATRYYYPEIMTFLSPFEGHIADNTGLTPLMYMTLRNDRNMVRILAPHGSRQMTTRGTTALMMAVSRGYYECAGILHEMEAGMQDHRGRTALMIAAGCGNSELVRLMIGKEAGMKDVKGRRASDYARHSGYSNVVFFLHRWESW